MSVMTDRAFNEGSASLLTEAPPAKVQRFKRLPFNEGSASLLTEGQSQHR